MSKRNQGQRYEMIGSVMGMSRATIQSIVKRELEQQYEKIISDFGMES